MHNTSWVGPEDRLVSNKVNAWLGARDVQLKEVGLVLQSKDESQGWAGGTPSSVRVSSWWK